MGLSIVIASGCFGLMLLAWLGRKRILSYIVLVLALEEFKELDSLQCFFVLYVDC